MNICYNFAPEDIYILLIEQRIFLPSGIFLNAFNNVATFTNFILIRLLIEKTIIGYSLHSMHVIIYNHALFSCIVLFLVLTIDNTIFPWFLSILCFYGDSEMQIIKAGRINLEPNKKNGLKLC